MTMPLTDLTSFEQLFRHTLALVGSNIQVGLTDGRHLRGKLVNAAPDSFLMETNGRVNVVRFGDIVFLDQAL